MWQPNSEPELPGTVNTHEETTERVVIELPGSLKSGHIIDFFSTLNRAEKYSTIEFDFQNLKRVTPAAMVAIVSTVQRWKRNKKAVIFSNIHSCQITAYLQRMDFFRCCDVELPETFHRRQPDGRFVPVRYVDHSTEQLGTEMAECLAPGGGEYGHPMADLFDLLFYVVTETANNVRQHSGGSGFVSAQVSHKEGLLRLAIADNGRGILQSFRDAGVAWSFQASQLDAVKRALEPKVSSKHGLNNEGVGLTLVTGLARLLNAWALVVSGTGMIILPRKGEYILRDLSPQGSFPGTMVAMAFRLNAVSEYASLLHTAKCNAGLLAEGPPRAIFEK